jgi:hypothetical protein
VLEVERLLYRHEGLEKLLVAHEETFIQLQTMTEVQGLEEGRLGILRRGTRGIGGDSWSIYKLGLLRAARPCGVFLKASPLGKPPTLPCRVPWVHEEG